MTMVDIGGPVAQDSWLLATWSRAIFIT